MRKILNGRFCDKLHQALKVSVFGAVLAVLSASMVSCNKDGKMAAKMDGVWTTDMLDFKDADGDLHKKRITYVFDYDAEAKGKGGEFIEKQEITFQKNNDGLIEEGKVYYNIKGKWEISKGELKLSYTLSTFDLAVPNLEAYPAEDADYFTKHYYHTESYKGTWFEVVEGLTESLRAEYYKEYHQFYKDCDANGVVFKNVEIGDGTMSFDNEKGEKLSFTKVSKGEKGVNINGEVRRFKGLIDGEIECHFDLVFEEPIVPGKQNVTGTYYYDKDGPGHTLELRGTYEVGQGEAILNLSEYLEDGTENVSIFVDKEGDKFEGVFQPLNDPDVELCDLEMWEIED